MASNEGCVYFVLAHTSAGPLVKIGHAGEHPGGRWSQLSTSSSVPLMRWAYIEGSRRDEARFHERFRKYRHHGEWFRLAGWLRRFIEDIEPNWLMERNPTDYEIAAISWVLRGREEGLPEDLGRAMRSAGGLVAEAV